MQLQWVKRRKFLVKVIKTLTYLMEEWVDEWVWIWMKIICRQSAGIPPRALLTLQLRWSCWRSRILLHSSDTWSSLKTRADEREPPGQLKTRSNTPARIWALQAREEKAVLIRPKRRPFSPCRDPVRPRAKLFNVIIWALKTRECKCAHIISASCSSAGHNEREGELTLALTSTRRGRVANCTLALLTRGATSALSLSLALCVCVHTACKHSLNCLCLLLSLIH